MREIEEWRDIEGFDGYQVSSLGNIKSLDRVDSLGHHRKEKILKPVKTKIGYLGVALCKDGKRDFYTIHRLVANAFIPNPVDLLEDGIVLGRFNIPLVLIKVILVNVAKVKKNLPMDFYGNMQIDFT